MKCFHIVITTMFVLSASTLSSSDAAAKYRSQQVCKEEICAVGFQRCIARDRSVAQRNFCVDARWKCMELCTETQCEGDEICR
jgi:hypothetical protein